MGEPRVYAGMDATARRADRRARLLAAGLDLFGTRGYARTTIEQVCAAAGVSTRHFYESFRSREALLQAVYEDVIAALTDEVLAARDRAPEEAESRFRAGIAAFCLELTADTRRARVVLFEVVGVSPALETRRHEVIRGFALLVEEEAVRWSTQGQLPDRAWDLTAVAVVGAIHELLIDWLQRDRPHPVERIVDEALRLVLGALRG